MIVILILSLWVAIEMGGAFWDIVFHQKEADLTPMFLVCAWFLPAVKMLSIVVPTMVVHLSWFDVFIPILSGLATVILLAIGTILIGKLTK